MPSSQQKTVTVHESGRVQRQAKRGQVVAVTGACSFLGKNLVALLEEDPEVSKVVVLDIRNSPAAGSKTCFYETDLMEPGVESRISEVLQAEHVSVFAHLAFSGGPGHAVAWSHELESVGTMHVLSACRQHRLDRFLTCSSTLVYGALPTHPNYLTESAATPGMYGSAYVADKVDVERQVGAYAEDASDTCVTLLRMAPMLGPSIGNFLSRWLSRTLVPTALGYDPLLQVLHEADAVAAVKLALGASVPGVFNIVGRGVLPVSTVVHLAGRVAVPTPFSILRRVTALLWVAQLAEAPPEFTYLLRYMCVADGGLAQAQLGFLPAYSTADAVLDFEGAQRLRDSRLLEQTT